MRKIFHTSTLMLIVAALCAPAATARTQRARASATGAQTTATARAPFALPASDAVLMVDLKRLLTEAVPRALAGDAARLAQVNADIEGFKTRTGVDARAFDTVAAGARFVQLPSGALKIDHVVALARGTFRADAVVASARAASGGSLQERQHGGKTVYVFSVNDRVKLFGLLNSHVRDLAIAVLDQNTLAVGEPEAVMAAVDAQGGRGRVDAALMSLVQTPGELVAFAGNVPAGALAGMDTGLPNVDRALASIRGFYGSVGSTPAGFRLMTTLRTQNAADARQLHQTADAVKQIAPGLLSMAGERWRFAQGLINTLAITTKGSDVQMQLEIPQKDVTTILRSL